MYRIFCQRYHHWPFSHWHVPLNPHLTISKHGIQRQFSTSQLSPCLAASNLAVSANPGYMRDCKAKDSINPSKTDWTCYDQHQTTTDRKLEEIEIQPNIAAQELPKLEDARTPSPHECSSLLGGNKFTNTRGRSLSSGNS